MKTDKGPPKFGLDPIRNADDKYPFKFDPNYNTPDKRLVRVETMLARLLIHFGMQPNRDTLPAGATVPTNETKEKQNGIQ